MVTKVDSGVIVHDGGTIKDALDNAKPIADYVALRAYTRNATQVRITSNGTAGFFYYDAADTTSTDNDGTVIVSANGKRWKRIYAEYVNILWFGAVADGSDTFNKIQAAINTGSGVFIPDGDYIISATLNINTAGQKVAFQSRNARIITATDITALKLNKSFIEIENGSIVGKAPGTTSTSAGIQIYDSQRSRIAFTYITNFAYGISSDGAVSNWVNRIDGCYLYLNKRAGIYKTGHACTITGGEIAGSVYGVLHAQLLPGTALAIDRDYGGVLGQSVQVTGCTIEGIGTGQVRSISGATDNGSGLIRLKIDNHGFSSGDIVAINNVTGTVEADGVWPIKVIDANYVDLKSSTFTNAYLSGGTARRGVGVYVGMGQTGIHVSDCYFESVPVAVQYGDAYKNNDTTAHTTVITGGKVVGCFLMNDNTNGCLLAYSRTSSVAVNGNSGFMAGGYKNTLLNSVNDNYNSQIANFNNYGFTAQYATAGTQATSGMVIKPSSKNGGSVLEVQVPSTSGSQSLGLALRVTAYNGAPSVQIFDPAMLLSGAQFGIDGPVIKTGTGVPEGVVTAKIGSLYMRLDGGASTTFYVKQTGTGNTGWVAK